MRYLLAFIGLWGALGFPKLAFGDRPAGRLLEENRLDEAAAVCRQFEMLSTYDKDNFVDCAWVYYRTGRVEAAEKLMDRLRVNFNTPDFQLLTAYGYIAKKQFDKARTALNGLSSRHKGSAFGVRVEETTGELYEAIGQPDTAAFLYMHVVDEKPGSGVAHWALGRYYLTRGDSVRARKHLEKTTALWPKHLASRYNLAVLSISQENDRDAAKWLAECYRLNKADAGVLEQMGSLYERKGQLPTALKFWQKALAINPRSALASEKMARYGTKVIDKLIEARQYKEAMEQVLALAGEGPVTGALMLRRGIIYRNLGNYDKALADLLKYVQDNPPNGSALRELGICYLNLKLVDKAGTNFLEATVVEPDNGMNWAWLAFALETKKEYKKARDAWRKAVALLKDGEEQKKAVRRLAAMESKIGSDKSGPDEELEPPGN